MKIDEENFIEEITKRNEKAIEFVMESYGGLVYGIVLNVLRTFKNESLVEECVSDVFFSVWSKIEKFNGGSKEFKNWIAGISKFKAIDYYRKYINEIEKKVSEDKEIADSRSLEDEVITSINTRSVIKFINDFGEPDRSIFIMKFLWSYKSKRISELLGITVSTVNTKISRGRRVLKERYKTINEEVNHG